MNAMTENIEDEQIEGQLSIADWMETVREEKYGKQDVFIHRNGCFFSTEQCMKYSWRKSVRF